MILTCPDCATRYFVDEAKLGPGGRKVRCASCGASWRAEPEVEPLDLAAAAVPVAPVVAAPEPVRPAGALPKSYRAQQEARRRTREAVAAGVVWASLAAVLVAVVLAAVIFRVQVVRLWPRTAGAYAALRLPVNPLGLQPEGVQASPGLQDGHAVLVVRGLERNVEAVPRPPAPLQVSLYDRSGVRLATTVARVDGEALKPGETRAFQTAFTDPPLAGAQVGVDFAFELLRRSRPPLRRTMSAAGSATGSRPLALRGLAAVAAPPASRPQLAQPLPANSPYALPAAASAQAAGGAAPVG
jgi:predicted Zn finger-like uncharacterized protein